MRKIAKTFIAGVLSLSMCVSPIGVMAGETPFEEAFVEEETTEEEAGYFGEENVYDEEPGELVFNEEVTTEEEPAYDEPSFVEEDQFVEGISSWKRMRLSRKLLTWPQMRQ